MIGHGKSVGFDVINGNIAYLRKAKEIHAANSTAESYAEALNGGGWVDFSSLLLCGIINP